MKYSEFRKWLRSQGVEFTTLKRGSHQLIKLESASSKPVLTSVGRNICLTA